MFFFLNNKSCNCSLLVLSVMKGVIMLLAHLSKLTEKKKNRRNGALFLAEPQ